MNFEQDFLDEESDIPFDKQEKDQEIDIDQFESCSEDKIEEEPKEEQKE